MEVKRVIKPKKNKVVGIRLDVNEKPESKIKLLDQTKKQMYAYGKVKVTHVGPEVKDTVVGEIVYLPMGLVMPINPIHGMEESNLLVIFTETAADYSVSE